MHRLGNPWAARLNVSKPAKKKTFSLHKALLYSSRVNKAQLGLLLYASTTLIYVRIKAPTILRRARQELQVAAASTLQEMLLLTTVAVEVGQRVAQAAALTTTTTTRQSKRDSVRVARVSA